MSRVRMRTDQMRSDAASLLDAGRRGSHVQRFVTTQVDRMISEVIRNDLSTHGPAPVPFALIMIGSNGTQQMSTHSDIDCAIVLPNGTPATAPSRSWFKSAAMRWASPFAMLREPEGLAFCRYASPVGTEKDMLISTSAEFVANASQYTAVRDGLRDFRYLYGDLELSKEFQGAWVAIDRDFRERDARINKAHAQRSVQEISPEPGKVNLKEARKAVDSALHSLAITHDIRPPNWMERADALGQEGVLGDVETIHHVMEHLSERRLRNHLETGGRNDVVLDDRFEDEGPVSHTVARLVKDLIGGD